MPFDGFRIIITKVFGCGRPAIEGEFGEDGELGALLFGLSEDGLEFVAFFIIVEDFADECDGEGLVGV